MDDLVIVVGVYERSGVLDVREVMVCTLKGPPEVPTFRLVTVCDYNPSPSTFHLFSTMDLNSSTTSVCLRVSGLRDPRRISKGPTYQGQPVTRTSGCLTGRTGTGGETKSETTRGVQR